MTSPGCTGDPCLHTVVPGTRAMTSHCCTGTRAMTSPGCTGDPCRDHLVVLGTHAMTSHGCTGDPCHDHLVVPGTRAVTTWLYWGPVP